VKSGLYFADFACPSAGLDLGCLTSEFGLESPHPALTRRPPPCGGEVKSGLYFADFACLSARLDLACLTSEFGFESPHPALMRRPPRRGGEVKFKLDLGLSDC